MVKIIVEADGTKYWLKDGRVHREDGPAIERPNGDKAWFLCGAEYDPVVWLTVVHEMRN